MIDDFPATPEIVVPRQRRAGFPGAVVHRSSDLCSAHVTTRHDIRTVNPLVTVLDLGVVLGGMEIAEIIITARQKKLFEPVAIEATLSRLARQGRTGVKNARHALELIRVGDRPAESVLELRFHHGPGQQLPAYEYQWMVTTRGRTYFIDFAYPSVQLAIEVDGYETRRSRRSFDDDAERQNHLVLAGWTFLRVTWTRLLHDPSGVARDIVEVLGTKGFDFRR
jgi:very-short-patch-repair endonuclease